MQSWLCHSLVQLGKFLYFFNFLRFLIGKMKSLGLPLRPSMWYNVRQIAQHFSSVSIDSSICIIGIIVFILKQKETKIEELRLHPNELWRALSASVMVISVFPSTI